MAAVVALVIGFSGPARADDAQRPREILSDSIKEVAAVALPGRALDPATPTVVRSVLSDSEVSATMQFEVALKMRNLGELRDRVANGEVIPQSDMADKYYPGASDYEAAIEWIESLGLTVTNRYDNHLSFFVRGSVGQIRDALKVDFARVAYLGKEYTSAVSAPSVPQDLVPSLVGINGLQTHLRMRSHLLRLKPSGLYSNYSPYGPNNLAVAYNSAGLSETGTGETIGLVGYAFPSISDITQFWSNYGIKQSATAVTEVSVGAGPPSNPDPGDAEEITLDAEWCSSMAPASTVRIYGSPDSDLIGSMAFQQIITDLPSHPQMRQISVSYGQGESEYTQSQFTSTSQYLATIAGAGVTCFFSSGDGGSRPDLTTGGYSYPAAIQVSYPASDPSVTAVGGTSLTPTNYYGAPDYKEVVWNSNGGASGGGQSTQFSRPIWQAGTGVSNGSFRLVPDVAASADPNDGADVIFNGTHDTIGGTSWAAPTWAGFCALFNQARTAASLGPVGLLNPKIYPLLGGPCFQDITSGNNGDYFAGVGYDECTGVGSPNVGLLVQALSLASPATLAPVISIQPVDQTVTAGQNGTLSVTVDSYSATTYQWQLKAPGSASWVDVTNNSTFSGSSTDALLITAATTAMGGDQFQCVITNLAGTVTSAVVLLNIPPVAPVPVQETGYLEMVTEGASFSVGPFSGYSNSVIGPVTYQWYHDGKPIPTATSFTYSVQSASFSSSGDYVLAATNPGGTVATYLVTVDVTDPTNANAWMDAQQLGSVVYFLYSSPAQILRYDMKAGAWLAPVALSETPTAFRTATEGVYVAFGRTTWLYTPDLSTGTPLANTANSSTSIFVNGNYAYLLGTSDLGNTGVYTTLNRNGGAYVSTFYGSIYDSYFTQGDVSSQLGKVFGWSYSQLISMNLNQDGTVSLSSGFGTNSPETSRSTRVYVFPGGQWVAANGGAVCNGSNLSFSGSFGLPFDDLCFLGDGSPVAVRGDELTLYKTGSLGEVGRVALSGGALRIFSSGAKVVCFSPPAEAGGSVGVETVTESQLAGSPRQVAPLVSADSVSFVPDDGFLGADGKLYLLSKLYRSIFEWNPATLQYGSSIPLQGSPEFISYSATLNRIYLAYNDQRITKIDLAASDAESAFATTPTALINFAAVDSQVYMHVRDAQDSGEIQYLYDSNGNPSALQGYGYFPGQVYWDSAAQAIFDNPTYYSYLVQKLPLSAGAFGTAVNSQDGSEGSNAPGPIRFSGDGSLLVNGNGIVYSTANLAQVGVLGDSLLDAAWLGTTVSTLNLSGSGSEVQQWGGNNYLLSHSSNLPGYPLRIWPLPSNELLAMTIVNSRTTLTVLSAGGNPISPNSPAITVEPQSQNVGTGSTVVFSAASPDSASYQWQLDGTNLTDGSTISGATGPQLVLGNVGTASAGSYTCVVTNLNGSNYTTPANLQVQAGATPGLVSSVSARALVGSKEGPVTSGFVIAGKTSRTVLVQALGPALAPAPYSVAAPLQHPALSIHQTQNGKDVVLYSNTGWGSNPVLLGAAAKLSALPVLQPGAADSEILVTLPPGSYTAEVSGADGGTGVALVAIYEMP